MAFPLAAWTAIRISQIARNNSQQAASRRGSSSAPLKKGVDDTGALRAMRLLNDAMDPPLPLENYIITINGNLLVKTQDRKLGPVIASILVPAGFRIEDSSPGYIIHPKI